ncbi:LysR family transcriptional regulator [Leisingera sp. ANG-Vp]|uniref:LysR family transcriptional regulator n=1 Tax=Leisingera sp. ANG-Vp TaxID=1577896 RepID=UPI0006900BE4|nr:LysR family transcriptional regulator [Leisingera sp. ANG-Vp]
MHNAPSLTGLRAFEAVIRHGSLTGAAQELCVTPAAISHRLKDLEARSETRLCYRESGQFLPTPQGRAVLAQLGDAFKRIRIASRMIGEIAAAPALEVVASYSFAVSWLIPNLLGFQASFPDLKITIEPSHTPVQKARISTSLVIVHSGQRPDGGDWEPLFEDICAVVCSSDHPVLEQDSLPETLSSYPLVHISHEQGSRSGEFSWHDWGLHRLGAAVHFPAGLQVTAEHAAIDAVQSGDCLALVSLMNADRGLRAGSLGYLAGTACRSGQGYWVRSAGGPGKTAAAAEAFKLWLQTETAETLKVYQRGG